MFISLFPTVMPQHVRWHHRFRKPPIGYSSYSQNHTTNERVNMSGVTSGADDVKKSHQSRFSDSAKPLPQYTVQKYSLFRSTTS